MPRSWTPYLSPALTVIILAGGFLITKGQDAQTQKDTCRQLNEHISEYKEFKTGQNLQNKELIAAIQDLRIAIVELKTELKERNRR